MEKKYNVYIVRDKDDVAVSLIGQNLSGSRADRREDTGLSRIDSANYSVISVEVGDVLDNRYKTTFEK